jgi:hypothetical protein
VFKDRKENPVYKARWVYLALLAILVSLVYLDLRVHKVIQDLLQQ